MRTKEQIKVCVEEFLLKDSVFEYILKSTPNIYADKLKLLFTEEEISSNIEFSQSVHFAYEPDGIKFIGNPIIHRYFEDEIESDNYPFEAIYISDFEFNGSMYKTEMTPIELKIEATVVIFIRKELTPPNEGWFIVPDIINLMDKTSYSIWDKKNKTNELLKLEDELKIKFE